MAMTLQDILASRKQLYDPQRALIAQQQVSLAPEEAAANASLDASKTLGYEDIDNTANARGLIYSGDPLKRRELYMATKYLPAKANLKSDFSGRRSKLEAALLGINQDETTSAQQLQTEQQKAEADAAYKAEQLQLQRERAAQSLAIAQVRASKASAPKAPTTAERQSAFNQDLLSAFQYANANYKPFIREQVAQQLAATYGLPIDVAQKQVNSVFTDSWDKAKRGVR